MAQKTPQLVAPGTVSTPAPEYCTTLSPDGTTLYFVREMTNGNDAIMQSQWTDQGWGVPTVTSFSGTFSDTDPMLSPDGNTFYFMTNRNRMQDGWQDYDIWISKKQEDQWQAPTRLPDFINTSFTEGFPSVTSEGHLYFFRSNGPGHSEQDIWYARKVGGGFDTPAKLPNGINTEKWDGHPFVSPDETFLIFYSSGREDGYGRCDLYISYRTDGVWSEPKNLGDLINTEVCEMVPYVSPDKSTLYFSRIEDGTRNIYQISFQEVLKSQP